MQVKRESKDYRKAVNKMYKLLEKSKEEYYNKGVRENLGYDQQSKLDDYMNTLNLTYPERCLIISEFYFLCAHLLDK